VNAVNDAPVAVADSYMTDEDTPLLVPAPGLLANDTDVEGDALSAVLVTGPAHGSLTLNSDGSFVYTPGANYNGVDSFTYKANDGMADSAPVTVTLSITPVNDVPVFVTVSVTPVVDENGIVTLSGSFEDPDSGDTHTLNVDWGDGSTSVLNLGAGVFTFTAMHQYLDDNPSATTSDNYGIPLSLADDQGGSTATMSSTKGNAFSRTGSFTDPGTQDTWTATVDYGDGSGAQPLALNADKTFALDRVYGDNGVYTVTVSVRDDDSGTGTRSSFSAAIRQRRSTAIRSLL
jgi:VCBS repeat-containing protein